ncbi:MAG: histidine kinase [Clostridia bacterium]|nr:histidine kinase [Clostridia bacterium]
MMQKKSLWYFVKRFKRNSVFVRNLLLFLVVLMIPTLMFSYYLTNQTSGLLREQNADSSLSALERIADGLRNQLAETEYMTTHAGFRSDVQQFVLSAPEEGEAYEGSIVEYLNTYVSVKKYVDSLYVYSMNTGMLVDNHGLYHISEFSDISWLDHVVPMKVNDSLFIGRKKDGGFMNCITVIKPIHITPDYMAGVVVCNISIKEITKMFGDIAGIENTYIVQDNGNLIYCKDSKAINKSAPEEILSIVAQSDKKTLVGEKYGIFGEWQYVSKVSVKEYGMHILSLTPESYYQERVQSVQNSMLLFMGLLSLIAIAGACFLAFRSFVPIRSIYEIVSDETAADDIEQINEFLMIESNIKKKLARNEEMDRELKLRIELLKKAQLTALQAQINPHFLYNTLDNLNWMAFKEIGGKNPVSDGLVSLSLLFYESAKDERYVVTLEQELQFAELYLSIIKMRYGDMVKTNIFIPPELYNTPIVKICLQPLIENAIYHGIKPKGNGEVNVMGRMLKDAVELTVEDDGVGMTEEEMERLNQTLQEEYVGYSGSIGVRNTNQRIKLVFGENYGVKVEKSTSGGLKIVVILPKS